MMKRAAATILRRRIARARRIALGLRMMFGETPAAQGATLFPQRIGAKNGQYDGNHHTPKKEKQKMKIENKCQ